MIGILASLKPGDYSKVLEIGDLKIKFKPLSYREMNEGAMGQFEVQRIFMNLDTIEDADERNNASHQALERITYLTMELIARTIEYIETPGASVTEQEFKPLNIECDSCQNKYEQPFTLNPADFFG